MGVDVLKVLGFRSYLNQRAARIFKRHEQRAINERTELRGGEDGKSYTTQVREHISQLEEPIREDDCDLKADADHA